MEKRSASDLHCRSKAKLRIETESERKRLWKEASSPEGIKRNQNLQSHDLSMKIDSSFRVFALKTW